MAGKSDYLANKISDLMLGGVAYTPPATYYLALYTTSPTDSGGGVEVVGGSYERVAIANNLTNFPAAVAGLKSNALQINFPRATADWGLVVASALCDAPTAGNVHLLGDTLTPRNIVSGTDVFYPPGTLTFTEY